MSPLAPVTRTRSPVSTPTSSRHPVGIVPPLPGALLTDLYELNMAASYLRRGMTAAATFSLFVRNLPASRGFLVAAGVDECVDWLEQFGFEGPDLEYLGAIGFDDDA